jgi:hypothetical protein
LHFCVATDRRKKKRIRKDTIDRRRRKRKRIRIAVHIGKKTIKNEEMFYLKEDFSDRITWFSF